jgi:hypothetical protein
MKDAKTYKVYYLSGPNGEDIFYIGITTGALEFRLRCHISGTNGWCGNGLKNDKINKYGNTTEIHEITTIEVEEDKILLIEDSYAREYKNAGYDICNVAVTPLLCRRKDKVRTASVRIDEEAYNIVSEYLRENGDQVKIGKFFGNAAVKEVERLKKEKVPKRRL